MVFQNTLINTRIKTFRHIVYRVMAYKMYLLVIFHADIYQCPTYPHKCTCVNQNNDTLDLHIKCESGWNQKTINDASRTTHYL